MTTLAKMAIELTVENRALKNQLNDVAKQLDKLEKKTEQSAGKFEKWVKGLAAGFTVAAVARKAIDGIRDAMERIDSQGKVAQSFGLLSDEFAALAHAADLSGVSVDYLGGAFRKMSALVGSAQQGNKSAIQTLERLGLKAENISRNPSEAMAQFADAIAGIGDQYQRTKSMQDVFGKGAAKLAPLFESGGNAIRNAAGEAAKFRININERDRAIIEQANDEWRRMGVIIEGIYNQIAIGLAPAIQALAQNVITLNDQWATLEHNQSKVLDDGIAKLTTFEEMLGALGTAGEFMVTGLQAVFWSISRIIVNAVWATAELHAGLERLAGIDLGSKIGRSFAKGMIEESDKQFAEIEKRFIAKTFRERMLENKQAAIETAKAREKAIADQRKIVPDAGRSAAAARGEAPFPSALSGADAFSQSFMNRRNAEIDSTKRFQGQVVDKLDDIVHALEFGEMTIAAFDGGGV